ncbi:MAG: hypothetical protein RLZZ541_1313 [Pseudomonadota bacterium]
MPENIKRWSLSSVNIKDQLFYVYDDLLKKEIKFSMPNVKSVEIEGEFAIARSDIKTMRIHLHDGARTFI